MLKIFKKPILRVERFCQFGKRWYFCTRFRLRKGDNINVKTK